MLLSRRQCWFSISVVALSVPVVVFDPRAATALMAKTPRRLRKWSCVNQDCEPYVYDPSLGDENVMDPDNPIPPGVAFEDLPQDWVCPVCADPKHMFLPLDEWVEIARPA